MVSPGEKETHEITVRILMWLMQLLNLNEHYCIICNKCSLSNKCPIHYFAVKLLHKMPLHICMIMYTWFHYLIVLWSTQRLSTFMSTQRISRHVDITFNGKSKLQVPDTGTWVLDNTRPFWRSSIVCFWMPPARSKGRKYHISGQYWYT